MFLLSLNWSSSEVTFFVKTVLLFLDVHIYLMIETSIFILMCGKMNLPKANSETIVSMKSRPVCLTFKKGIRSNFIMFDIVWYELFLVLQWNKIHYSFIVLHNGLIIIQIIPFMNTIKIGFTIDPFNTRRKAPKKENTFSFAKLTIKVQTIKFVKECNY